MSGAKITVDLEAQDNLTSALKGMEGSITQFGSKAASMLKGVAAGFLAFEAISKGVSIFGGFLSDAMEAEQATVKLEAVLKATGNASGFTATQLGALADQMEQTTLFTAEAVQGGMSILATFKNIKGDQFTEATKAAADMATVVGGDLNGAMMQIGKALNDPVQGMSALARAGVSFTDQQKEQVKALQEAGDMAGAQKIILEELQGEFGGAAEAMGGTFAGRIDNLKDRLGNLGEQIATAVMPILDVLVGWAESATTFFEENMDTIQEWVQVAVDMGVAVLEWMVEPFKTLLSVGVGAFTLLEVLITNWRDAWEANWLAIQAAAVKAFNVIAYYVTEVVPAYFSWFVDNAGNIFETLWSGVSSIFTNMFTNIKDFFTAVVSWLNGDGFDFKWTGLLEGFENTIDELPKIAERIPGALEKGLGDEAKKKADKIGGEFQSKLQQRLTDFGLVDGVKPTKKKTKPGVDMTPNMDMAGGYTGTGPSDKKKEETKGEDKKGRGGGSGSGSTAATESERAASFEDLNSLYKRIAGAAAGTTNDPAKQTADSSKRTADASEKSASVEERIAATAGRIEKLVQRILEDPPVTGLA